jgi:hypothetical protein
MYLIVIHQHGRTGRHRRYGDGCGRWTAAAGLEIAARCHIAQHDGAWTAPSQSSSGRYAVVMSARGPRCTCPDHETRGQDCEHIFAVRYVIDREKPP